MPKADRSLRRALVACTRDHPVRQPVLELHGHVLRHGVGRLGAAALGHGVVGCLWTSLRGTGLTDAWGAAAIRADYQAAVATHLRVLADLDLVDGALRAAGLDYLVIKGPVLAETVYSRPDLRAYLDLDVLVAPADFPGAVAVLEEAGCRVYERNWRLARQSMLGELRLFTPAGTIVDLHWHLVADRRVRDAFPVDLAEIRRRARWVTLGDRRVRTLDRADTVVHVALHASLTGGDRLVWLKDLEQALSGPHAPEWTELVTRAGEWGAGPSMALMLARTRNVLGTPVPEAVLAGLAGERLWRSVTRVVDAVAPLGDGTAGASVSRIVARAARADGRSSRRELGRRGLAWVWHGGPLGRVDLNRLFDPDHPASAAHDDGGEAERSAYLDAVCGQPG
jgi:hypothetical protein